MSKNRKGVSFTFLSILFLVIIAGMIGTLVFISHITNKKFSMINSSMDTFVTCESSSQVIKDVSNYLTEQAQFFVMTGDYSYAESYIKEKFVDKRQEKALEDLLETLDKIEDSDSVYQRVKIAMNQSSSLSSIELYAIRLMYAADGSKPIPSFLNDVNIRKKELILSSEELKKVAQKTLFDEGYLLYRDRVNQNCFDIINEIENDAREQLALNAQAEKVYLKLFNVLLFILSIVSVAYFTVVILFVLKPLKSFIQSLLAKDRLNVQGAQELRYLAETYNEVHEYEPLTRVLNRRAYNSLCEKYEREKSILGLLLVDLDNFKGINDTYGHSKGDEILKIVARALKNAYKNKGDVARIGGDEFAVLLNNVTFSEKDSIVERINLINKDLAALEEFESVSVSAGLAFSTTGFSKTLSENADAQLYLVKDEGKRGIKVCPDVL